MASTTIATPMLPPLQRHKTYVIRSVIPRYTDLNLFGFIQILSAILGGCGGAEGRVVLVVRDDAGNHPNDPKRFQTASGSDSELVAGIPESPGSPDHIVIRADPKTEGRERAPTATTMTKGRRAAEGWRGGPHLASRESPSSPSPK